MTAMIDREGRTWRVGDLVWDQENKRQGMVLAVVGQDILQVRWAGGAESRFVSGLVRTGTTERIGT